MRIMIREFHQISLRTRNSFGVDQQAARLVEFETPEDLRTLFAAGIPEKWTVLAGGNNILFTRDYDGVLLTPVARGITLLSDDGDEVRVRADAGVEWDDLVEWAVGRGLWGIENLSLIPGKAGAAPVQNIGAYGCEAKDAIRRVEMYCVETGAMLTLDAAHCGFGYRESVFKHDLKGRVIITAVEIALTHTPRPRLGYGDVEREVEARGGATLRNIREAICAIRRAKLPDPAVLGNAGSFFKNPVVGAAAAERLLAEYPDMPHYPAPEGRVKLAAGWLIDRAGMKGSRKGAVGVHERQALVLVNHGGATGGEVIAFAHEVQERVRGKFGIEIDTEVNIL
ncbi:MAG: UDP-N-acetylmuramate dehydrogenase [Alistipes senegalensis]|nr:UDP-N-acetylmuramate dehydrogenase [Alistipes senegalensis]